MEQSKSLLKLYKDVESVPVSWLWYPYIPSGKITILQGDPGDGKSTMMMNVIAALTTAGFTPDAKKVNSHKKVIYQCSEDDPADTIKPRLEACGADCSRVAFLSEGEGSLTLDDDVLRDAIIEFDADLLVIDPVQAYLGDNADLTNAKKTRRLMHKLGTWASIYDCAIVLIGHLNKNEGTKELYRSLGSIDLMAAARSVLQVYRVDGNDTERRVKQIKNSLAPIGKDIGFDIDPEKGFRWLCTYGDCPAEEKPMSREKIESGAVAEMLRNLLKDGPIKSADVTWFFAQNNVSMTTVNRIKKIAGIRSFRKNGQWYWALANNKEGEQLQC